MVIKGVSCAGARRLAVHLMRTDTNERAELKETRGTVAENLRGALIEMEAVAAGARTGKPFYHGSINTRADERLTPEQRMHSIDRLEAALGLTGQARVVVVHEKEGREHCHIVWSRIDLERMAAISDSHNYRKHEQVARDLEREFGHARVQGAHIERDGKARPERTPSHAEMLQAERTGLSAGEVKDKLTELWRTTDSGQAFAVALWQHGYVLARGDRRDFVVIDPNGGTHSLSRRIDGATAKDIRLRLADIDAARLPSVADAKRVQGLRRERDGQRAASGRDAEQDGARKSPPEIPRDAPDANRGRSHGTPEGAAAASRATDGFARAATSLLDSLASMFERGLSGDQGEAEHEKEKAARHPEPDQREVEREASVRNDEDERAKRRQAMLREFGLDRAIDDDQHRGPHPDRDPDRDRDRSR